MILIKNIFLLTILFIIVILINLPIISFDMMYQEQTTIYLANQSLSGWRDLLNVYLHPTWLNLNIPFFRPSGHFLVYQIFMPLVGWHNTLALNIISFTFLTFIGFFSIKLYKLLFPGFGAGALIAFSLYLMHPSLSISRLTFMHFDFAYVCFLVLSLYLFVLFCKKNTDSTRFHHVGLLVCSLVCFAIAVTFKEPAIMLGPVLFCYFVMSFHHRLFNQTSLLILFTIIAVSAFLSWYLFLSWPSLKYAGNSFHLTHSLGTANIFMKDVFGIQSNLIPFGTLPFEDYAWRTTVFTPAARYLMWFFFWLTLLCMTLVIRDKSAASFRQPLLFLFLASCLFMLLPLSWASGAPWHHSLTLICYVLMMGFSAEYLFRRMTFTKKYLTSCCIVFALLIAYAGVGVNFENIIKYYLEPNGFLGISLNRNAILSPPDIKLNNDSVLVVEDSRLHNDYFMGNAAYPILLFIDRQHYDAFAAQQNNFFVKFHHTYSGNLFRYAYLMPQLKEELYPFQIEAMDDIPNEIIYNWLQHFNHIFCVGYDAGAAWYDKTTAFKAALLKQQARRKLVVRNYHDVKALPGKIVYARALPFPDVQLCQFACDQDAHCAGITYRHVLSRAHHDARCYFHRV